MTETLYDGLARLDESFYTSLARMLNEETVQPQDLQMMGMLLPLGIEKGKAFKPVAQLKSAAAEAGAWLVGRQSKIGGDWWPGSQWKLLIPPIGPQTGFKWAVPNVDKRGAAFRRLLLASREARRRQLLIDLSICMSILLFVLPRSALRPLP